MYTSVHLVVSWNKVYMTYVTSWTSLICDVKILHILLFHVAIATHTINYIADTFGPWFGPTSMHIMMCVMITS